MVASHPGVSLRLGAAATGADRLLEVEGAGRRIKAGKHCVVLGPGALAPSLLDGGTATPRLLGALVSDLRERGQQLGVLGCGRGRTKGVRARAAKGGMKVRAAKGGMRARAE